MITDNDRAIAKLEVRVDKAEETIGSTRDWLAKHADHNEASFTKIMERLGKIDTKLEVMWVKIGLLSGFLIMAGRELLERLIG